MTYTLHKFEITSKPDKVTDVYEFYVDIEKPVRTLEVEVRFYDNLKINNPHYNIISKFGVCEESKSYKLKPKHYCDYTAYRIKIRKPKLLHSYRVEWSW